jgi:hypothetical protein
MNKNGTTSVKWVAPSADARRKGRPALPPPVNESQYRSRMRHEVKDILNERMSVTSPNDQSIFNDLTNITDTEQMVKLHAVTLAAAGSDEDKDAIIRCIRFNARYILDSAYKYVDLIAVLPGKLVNIANLHQTMGESPMLSTDSDGRIVHMKDHVHASHRFALEGSDFMNDVYGAGGDNRCRIVEMHLDDLDGIISYLCEHDDEDFDEDDFKEYQKHGVVKDGWL